VRIPRAICNGLILLVLLAAATASFAQNGKEKKPPPPVATGAGGKLVYAPDSLGNRIPDFSYCGYKASESAIPLAPVRVVVPVSNTDATMRIQAAIDYVSALPIDKNGFRGAVLLQKGTYEVNGTLTISASGVVLRGSGMMANGTVLKGTGFTRETLIRLLGKRDIATGEAIKITAAYVPVNATTLPLATAATIKAGDKIIVRRPSTAAWIHLLGTEHFGGGITALGWKPGERDLFFHRTVTAINGNTITIDAPITTALDTTYGGGTVAVYTWPGRINQSGIENLRCVSSFNTQHPKDEAHRWMAITIENTEDAWVRQVTFEHFAGSGVNVLETSQRITVEDCQYLSPVSEIGGQRRYCFFTTGEQTLFQRCYAEYGYHDFAVGYCAPGPNAFVQCESYLPYSFSGAIDSWASGVLFDVVFIDGNALRFGNRGQDGQGAGWAAANSLFWNCSAPRIDCYQPPGAQNWAFGSWSQFAGDGYWAESNNTISPRSFYYAQLYERLNRNSDNQSQILKVEGEASSSPTVEQAAALTAQAAKPRIYMRQWIETAAQRNSIATDANGSKTIDQIGYKKVATPSLSPAMHIQNGWLVRGNEVLAGKRMDVPWWSGGTQGQDLRNAKPAITRFVPGRTGKGLTDDLNEVTDSMKPQHVIGIEQNYGLWYDRRRDDHERIRRMDGEVWAPFYELPFARSGKETAWDGLSKYDLTSYNTWYWSRLKQFADLADQKGLLLVHQNYFQHNIIEAGAHYADFPWRTANNINGTGFPEPPPYAGDKRIFLAEQFYDLSNPVRRELHRKYIRQCLDNFKNNNGVIQLTGAEFTGPLHFVKFWLQVSSEWKKENKNKTIIGLSVTKDVQDAILNDPAYAATVDLIDIRYWHYQADGTPYAPPGGQSLAPRQQARVFKPKKTSFEQVYRAIKEYRTKYPNKAVMYSGDSYDAFGWAVFMAGGSLPVIPVLPTALLSDASTMRAMDLKGNPQGQWAMGDEGKSYLVYTTSSEPVQLDLLDGEALFTISWFNANDGKLISKEEKVKASQLKAIKKPQGGAAVLWLVRANG
jgi:hypothetical protein